MKNILINPETCSSQITIDEDVKLCYFLSKPLKEEAQTIQIDVKEGASLDLVLVDFSSSNLDFSLSVNLNRKSRALLSLASIGYMKKKKIFHFNVKHLEGDSYSRVVMSGINSGDGVLRFLGDSYIKNGAHRSDTRQEGRITNLSFDAKSEVSPSLLIKENDVNASHGAALGAYNPDQIFYLMSRGLSLQESQKLITFGSLLPVIEKLDDEKLISQAKKALEELTI